MVRGIDEFHFVGSLHALETNLHDNANSTIKQKEKRVTILHFDLDSEPRQ